MRRLDLGAERLHGHAQDVLPVVREASKRLSTRTPSRDMRGSVLIATDSLLAWMRPLLKSMPLLIKRAHVTDSAIPIPIRPAYFSRYQHRERDHVRWMPMRSAACGTTFAPTIIATFIVSPQTSSWTS